MSIIKYLIGVIISIPLLPILYIQGKKLRTATPSLPEASGEEGIYRPIEDTSLVTRVVFIGESTMAGVGVKTHEEGFAGAFVRALYARLCHDISWKVYAKSGYTAKEVAEFLVPNITEDNIDLFVIGLGGSDTFALKTPYTWQRDIEQLIDCIRTKYPTTPIAFCNMPPIKEFPAFTPTMKFVLGNLVEILGENLKLITEKYEKVYYSTDKLSLSRWMGKLPRNTKRADFFSDGIHPSRITYETWAKDMVDFVTRQKTA